MKNFNQTSGIILAVTSILTIITNYFNVIAVPVFWINVTVAVILGFVAFMQVYNCRSIYNHNPGRFWLTYSAVYGVVIVAVLFSTCFNIISGDLTVSLLMGSSPCLIPLLGAVFGDMERVSKGKDSTINTTC